MNEPQGKEDESAEDSSNHRAREALSQRATQLVWVAFSLVVLAILIAGWAAFKFSTTPADLDAAGSFLSGTSVGLFSFAGVVLIYVAFLGQQMQLLNQQEELRLSRVELRLTRAELKGQREQLSAQNETFQRQQFDSTFFQLLRLHHEIVSSIRMYNKEGREAIEVFVRALRSTHTSHDKLANTTGIERVQRAYAMVYSNNQESLGHYFRSLYHIVKFVHRHEFIDRRQYTAFVRAQLSSVELAALFYNGLSSFGNEKFKPLIEEYSLLKALPDSELLSPGHKAYYDFSAYAGSASRTPPGDN